MEYRDKQIILNREIYNGQETLNYQGNANQNYYEIPSYAHQNSLKKLK